MTPAWIPGIFAALMLTVAVLCTTRLAVARPWRPGAVVTDTDMAHLVMAIAMAGMLAPGLTIMPGTAWESLFGLLTAWFAFRVARDATATGVRALAGGHCAPHLVHSAAMLCMFLAFASPAVSPAVGAVAGMGGMGGPAARTLAFVFALTLAGYSIWDLDQLSGRRYGLSATHASPVPSLLLSPAVTVGCRIVMGVTMVFMMLVMI